MLFRKRQHIDYSPLPWNDYFDETLNIDVSDDAKDTFRVYLSNFTKPYTPKQNINDDSSEINKTQYERCMQVPTLVLLHGGGYSALTWAPFCKSIKQMCSVRCLAIDLRGHGNTKTSNDDDMSIERLSTDVIAVADKVHSLFGFDFEPKTIVIGHSMGGAMAIRCAAKSEEHFKCMVGFVVIDVVEGTAKEALPQMMSIINTRPKRFPTLTNAIEWTVRSGMTKNVEAARVSMPGNLVNMVSNLLATADISSSSFVTDDNSKCSSRNLLNSPTFETIVDEYRQSEKLKHQPTTKPSSFALPPLPPRLNAIKEAELFPGVVVNRTTNLPSSTITEEEALGEEGEEDSQASPNVKDNKNESKEGDNTNANEHETKVTGYCWRTNLQKTEKFWDGWFDGLSDQLLNSPVQGKFLLLAGIDRLDRALTIGQMQGKFMMKVLPRCGHAVHEDEPDKVAQVVADFLIRNKFTKAVD